MALLKELESLIDSYANIEEAKNLSRFFKTGKGQYAEGDIFLGIRVPKQREIAKKFKDMALTDIQKLLQSPYHEKRLIALFILVDQIKNKQASIHQEVFNLYMKNTKSINNWDLVDESAPKIVGSWLFDKDRSILYQLVKSYSLWERRISILSTLYFIRQQDFRDTLQLSEILLKDQHDLIHKATGWMLREVYKKDQDIAMNWVLKYKDVMPRTMLRYAIEKVPEKERKKLLIK